MFARLRYCGTGFKLAVRVRVFSKSSVGQLAEPLNSAQDVLNFWFGHNYLTPSGTNELIVANTVCYLEESWGRWFMGKDILFDINQRSLEAKKLIKLLGRDHNSVENDSSWQSPRGLLAQILVLDQFPRCAFRGTAQAFETDARAIDIATEAVEKGFYDDVYVPIERFFVTLALSHAEDIDANRLHVDLAQPHRLVGPPGHLPDLSQYFQSIPGYPHEHYDAVRRFGRFPHRNELLGRESTDEERAWLASEHCPGWARSQSAPEPSTLTYWAGRGLGDPIRFLLEFAGVSYSEEFVRSQAQFEALKDAGALAFGQVPMLEMGGLRVVQTQAILRHIARERGLAGESASEAATADMVVNAVLDCRMGLITARFQEDPRAAFDSFFDVALPRLCLHIERLRAHSGASFVAGRAPTYADVVLFEALAYAHDEADGREVLQREITPWVWSHYHSMRSVPALAEYLSSPRRQPPPDDGFVREISAILGL